MSDIVERVAKAIRARRNRSITPESEGTEYDRTIARAAISAIHPGLLDGTVVVVPVEPTKAMLNAADRIESGDYFPEPAPRIWRAMLAEATKARSEK